MIFIQKQSLSLFKGADFAGKEKKGYSLNYTFHQPEINTSSKSESLLKERDTEQEKEILFPCSLQMLITPNIVKEAEAAGMDFWQPHLNCL